MTHRNKWGFPTIIPQASHDATIIPQASHTDPNEPAQPKPWYQNIWEKSMGHIAWPL